MPGVPAEEFLAIVDRVPTTVPEVIQQQLDLQELLERPGTDGPVSGLAYFNLLYRIITETVNEALVTGRFTHPDFLAILDVEFAKRYFVALAAWRRDPAHAPKAWSVLLDRSYDTEISAMQYAVTGVNAHINFDLALSVVSTFTALGRDFDEDYREDYKYVNDIFHQRIPDLKDMLENSFWATVDDLGGSLDDRLEDFAVVMSRELAWQTARRIWPDRHDKREMAKETRRLDRFASIIGRGLLMHL